MESTVNKEASDDGDDGDGAACCALVDAAISKRRSAESNDVFRFIAGSS